MKRLLPTSLLPRIRLIPRLNKRVLYWVVYEKDRCGCSGPFSMLSYSPGSDFLFRGRRHYICLKTKRKRNRQQASPLSASLPHPLLRTLFPFLVLLYFQIMVHQPIALSKEIAGGLSLFLIITLALLNIPLRTVVNQIRDGCRGVGSLRDRCRMIRHD